ncbi:somatostatin receptor type 5-like [Discoglossus pictus]
MEMDSYTIDPLFLDSNLSLFNYTEYDDDYHTLNMATKSYILYFFVCAIGIVGNALAIYVFLRYHQMKTTSNIYVFSLALGDLVYMFCLLLFAIEVASTSWLLGKFMCRLFWAISTLVEFSSIYFLTIMCIFDFGLVYFPDFSNKRIGPKVATVTSICVWFVCLLLGIPIFYFADVDEYNSCKIVWPEPFKFWSIAFISYQFTMAFALPIVLNSIFLILTVVRKTYQKKPPSSIYNNSTMMLFVLCLVFVIFWAPMHILEMLYANYEIIGLGAEDYYYVSLIPYMKSCVYPVLYGLLSPSFKAAYKKVLCCKASITIPQEGSRDKPDDSSSKC